MYEKGDYELYSNEAVFQTGLDFLESDHFEEALRAFDYIVEQQPYNVDALFHRGLALVNLSRSAEAIIAYKSAIELAPTEAHFHCHCGYALLVSGNADEALGYFDHALDLQPDSFQAKVYKACALAEKRQFGTARTLLEEVLAERPDDVEPLRHYAAILAATGEEEKALAQLNRILKNHPNNREAIRNKGVVLLRQGRRKEAVCSFRELIALSPDELTGWILLLETMAELQSWKELQVCATHALEAGHESPEIYTLRGRAYLQLGQTQYAVANLWRASKLSDKNPEVLYYLAVALMKDGKLRHSLKTAVRALQLKPEDRRIVSLKAELHHRLGDYVTELRYLQAALQAYPGDFDLVRLKVRCLLALDRVAEAGTFIDRFVVSAPEHVGALLLAAEVAERLGDGKKAQRYYSRIFQLSTVGPYAYQAYSAFLVRQEMPERALAVLATAKLAHPSDASIEASRCVALQSLGRHGDTVRCLEEFLEMEPATCDLHWLAAKSQYALEDYQQSLWHLVNARNLLQADGRSDVPTRWLIAEAFSLHRLGRTAEGILLLEKQIPEEAFAEEELYLAMGELCELGKLETKALQFYGQGLQGYPLSAQLHYRHARTCALLGKKTTAIEHLQQALAIQPELADRAVLEPAFKRYALSLSMNRLLGLRFVTPRIRLAACIAAWGAGAIAVSYIFDMLEH